MTPSKNKRLLKQADDTHLIKRRHKAHDALDAAYEKYLNGEHLSEFNLLNITRDFLFKKMYSLEMYPGFRNLGTSQTVEDWVQDAMLSIWETMQRGVEGLYSALVNRVAFTRRADAYNYMNKELKNKVKLEKGNKEAYDDDDGLDDNTENLEIYRSPGRNREGDDLPLRIPEGINATDLDILKLISSGSTQKEAPEILDMNIKTLEKRLERLRSRVKNVEVPKREKRLSQNDQWYKDQQAAKMARLEERTFKGKTHPI
jgi:hypothetical protein